MKVYKYIYYQDNYYFMKKIFIILILFVHSLAKEELKTYSELNCM